MDLEALNDHPISVEKKAGAFGKPLHEVCERVDLYLTSDAMCANDLAYSDSFWHLSKQ